MKNKGQFGNKKTSSDWKDRAEENEKEFRAKKQRRQMFLSFILFAFIAIASGINGFVNLAGDGFIRYKNTYAVPAEAGVLIAVISLALSVRSFYIWRSLEGH